MANSVNTSINVSINGDTSDISANIAKLFGEFSNIQSELNIALNDPLNTSINKVNELENRFYSAEDALKGFGGDYFNQSTVFLNNFRDEFEALKISIAKGEIKNEFDAINGLLESEVLLLSSNKDQAD